MRTDLCVRAVHKGEMRVDVRVREHVLAMDYPAATGKACEGRIANIRWGPNRP